MKCGIEIHQQLDTHKLFCNCPSEVSKEEYKNSIVRYLRPTKGEMGRIDKAAIYEGIKKITYYYDNKTSCLVELDEEPPHKLNEEALKIALKVAKLLNMTILDEIQFMRKTIIDGSIPSGFQRTALIAIDGFLTTKYGKVKIESLCLEEDSGRHVSKNTFKLDRLGIPLIEITTAPDIKNPYQAQEVAKKLGEILRSTGKVKRGIGTIRQDLNVSIKGGSRVELKGVQDLRNIPKIIEIEVKRQEDLIKKKIKVKGEVRKINKDCTTSFLRPLPGKARMYPETDVPIIKISKEMLKEIEEWTVLNPKKIINNLSKQVGNDLANTLFKNKLWEKFNDFSNKFNNIEKKYLATLLISLQDQIKKVYKENVKINDNELEKGLFFLNEGRLTKESLIPFLINLTKTNNIEKSLEKFKVLNRNEAEKIIKKLLKNKEDLPFGVKMGIVMKELRGKIDGKIISEIVKNI